MHGLIDVTPRVNIQGALHELSYHGQNLVRWAICSSTARTACSDEAYIDSYLRLTLEELDAIETQAARLRAALNAASLQHVSHETTEVAA